MKFPIIARFFVACSLAVSAAASSGCGGAASNNTDPCAQVRYGGKEMEPYADAARKFALCVPKGLTRNNSGGQTVFSGFAVPAGTNLESKTLVIVAGVYNDVQGATPFGQFVAGGVTFKRTRLDDGSAGHMTLHVTYTGTVNGQKVHFDFTHRAVNPGVFDPGNRPTVYDEAAQVKLTEVIMGTFRLTP